MLTLDLIICQKLFSLTTFSLHFVRVSRVLRSVKAVANTNPEQLTTIWFQYLSYLL